MFKCILRKSFSLLLALVIVLGLTSTVMADVPASYALSLTTNSDDSQSISAQVEPRIIVTGRVDIAAVNRQAFTVHVQNTSILGGQFKNVVIVAQGTDGNGNPFSVTRNVGTLGAGVTAVERFSVATGWRNVTVRVSTSNGFSTSISRNNQFLSW